MLPWLSESIKSRPKFYDLSVWEALLMALKNGASVTLGVGSMRNIRQNRSRNSGGEKDNETKTKEIISQLKNESPFCDFYKSGRLVIHANSYTHEKLMVIDNIKAYCGSFNFASNTGEFDLVSDEYGYKREESGSGYDHPGESMEIKDNLLGVARVLERITDKYND